MRSSGPAAARVTGMDGRVAREGVVALPGVDGSPSSVLPLSFLGFLFGVVVAEPDALRPRLRGVTVALLPVGVFSALLAAKAGALVGVRVSFISFSLGTSSGFMFLFVLVFQSRMTYSHRFLGFDRGWILVAFLSLHDYVIGLCNSLALGRVYGCKIVGVGDGGCSIRVSVVVHSQWEQPCEVREELVSHLTCQN